MQFDDQCTHVGCVVVQGAQMITGVISLPVSATSHVFWTSALRAWRWGWAGHQFWAEFSRRPSRWAGMEQGGVRIARSVPNYALTQSCTCSSGWPQHPKAPSLNHSITLSMNGVAAAAVQVAGHFTTCSITVLQQRDGPQFIFGLDMLKRHLCVLDMAAGGAETFWQPSNIPT